jgi:hypothetical protein
LYEFDTDGELLQKTGDRDTSYRGLATNETALLGPDADGNVTVLRRFDTESTNTAPIADAGTDRTVTSPSSITLDGTDSSDSDGDSLAFQWIQTSGPPVSLTDGNSATPTLSTPMVSSTTTLTFEMTVTDNAGASDTDRVQLTVSPESALDIPVEPIDGPGGSSTGDPHFTTFDGVAYDFQAAGEFVLTQDSDGSPTVQARFLPVADRDVSVVSAVATQLADQSVTIDARDSQMLTVDGTAQSLSVGESLAVGDGEIFRTQNRYTVVYPGADGDIDDGDTRMEVTIVDNRLDVVVEPNQSAVDSMSGLLGSPNGNAADDIARADGSTLSRPLSFEELYGQFRSRARRRFSTTRTATDRTPTMIQTTRRNR